MLTSFVDDVSVSMVLPLSLYILGGENLIKRKGIHYSH